MLLNTFSPRMVESGMTFVGKEITFAQLKEETTRPWCWKKTSETPERWLTTTSAISHENTAGIISTLLECKIPFKRENVSLGHGDVAHVLIPNFRATESREFSTEEILEAGMTFYKVRVYDPSLPRYEIFGQVCDIGGSLVTIGNAHNAERANELMEEAYQEDGNLESVWVKDLWEI